MFDHSANEEEFEDAEEVSDEPVVELEDSTEEEEES